MDPGFLDVLEKHPENADRAKNMLSILKRGPISPFISWHQGRPAHIYELSSFHTQADRNGGKELCGGTFLNPGSWDAALLLVTLSSMKHIIDGHGKIVYALVRPPGHHAQPTQADGYCFLNNEGLAVQLALDGGCGKGNGTAEGFYHSDKVLTISLHMNRGSWGPSNPQGGTVDELGEGEGFGYNLNIPLPNGTGVKGHGYAMQHLVVPAIEKFEPDMMVLVVGQDSSAVIDPNGRQCLTMEGYREIGLTIHGMADKYCNEWTALPIACTRLLKLCSILAPLLYDPIAYYPEDDSFPAKVIEAIKKRLYHFLKMLSWGLTLFCF
ncbi:unnamed protein product [Withania somnifera]